MPSSHHRHGRPWLKALRHQSRRPPSSRLQPSCLRHRTSAIVSIIPLMDTIAMHIPVVQAVAVGWIGFKRNAAPVEETRNVRRLCDTTRRRRSTDGAFSGASDYGPCLLTDSLWDRDDWRHGRVTVDVKDKEHVITRWQPFWRRVHITSYGCSGL